MSKMSITERSHDNVTQSHPAAKAMLTRPLINYTGRIIYHTNMMDIAFVCDELLQWVDKHPNDVVPIAFDMEWPFNYQTGAGKSAVIQLCADTTVCYVLHISNIKKLPAALTCLLYNKKVCLHGINIKNDFRKLQRDFPEANASRMIAQSRDLGEWCNEIIGSSERWSLERLVMFICKLRINKDDKVRKCRWDFLPLKHDQLLYAAIDVYISQVIYMDLAKREEKKIRELKEFDEKHGQA